jgi:hypothetical protein
VTPAPTKAAAAKTLAREFIVFTFVSVTLPCPIESPLARDTGFDRSIAPMAVADISDPIAAGLH